MTPDISAIAEKWWKKWATKNIHIVSAIEGGAMEATASLRAQLAKAQDESWENWESVKKWKAAAETAEGERDVALARLAKYRANECEFEDSLGAQEGN